MRSENFSAYDFIAQPVFVLGPDANNHPVFYHLNAAAMHFVDRPLDAVRGLPAYEVFHGRAAHALYRHQCMAWADGQATDYEVALPVKDRAVWVHTHLRPVRDAAGRLTHMVGISQDISKRRADLQVQAMDAGMVREMEDLVRFAAHDLRSPVGNLKSLAELMREDFVDHGDGKAELINMITTISDKTLSVVASIMDQALGTDTRRAQDRFDLGVECDDIMAMLDPTGEHSISYPREQLEADALAVHIILRNLVDNALKHSGRTAAQVKIEVSQVRAARLLFVIRDDGTGFCDDALTRLNAPSERDAGGFGLKGIHRLVRARGGQLIVMPPSDGQGAEIHVELPGKIIAAEVEDAPSRSIA